MDFIKIDILLDNLVMNRTDMLESSLDLAIDFMFLQDFIESLFQISDIISGLPAMSLTVTVMGRVVVTPTVVQPGTGQWLAAPLQNRVPFLSTRKR